MAVADPGPHETDAARLQRTLETEVAHQRADYRTAQRPGGQAIAHEQEQQVVAVADRSVRVDHLHAIAVAVEGDAEVGAALAHGRLQQAQVGRAAAGVDVEAVRLRADRDDIGAEIGEHARGDMVGRAMGAVEHDPAPAQIQARRGGILGGEASGHLLCLDKVSTGDGIIAALLVLEVLQRTGQTLAAARAGLQRVAQKTVNVPVAGGAALIASAAVQQALGQAQRTMSGRGRVVLRPSGTEPLVRVTVEGADTEEIGALATTLADAVRSASPPPAA